MRKSRARTGNVARHSHGIWFAIERLRASAGNYANYTNCTLPIAPECLNYPPHSRRRYHPPPRFLLSPLNNLSVGPLGNTTLKIR